MFLLSGFPTRFCTVASENVSKSVGTRQLRKRAWKGRSGTLWTLQKMIWWYCLMNEDIWPFSTNPCCGWSGSLSWSRRLLCRPWGESYGTSGDFEKFCTSGVVWTLNIDVVAGCASDSMAGGVASLAFENAGWVPGPFTILPQWFE